VVAIYTFFAIVYIQFLSQIEPPNRPKELNRVKIAIIKPPATPKPTPKPISKPHHIVPKPKRRVKPKPKPKIRPRPKRVVKSRVKPKKYRKVKRAKVRRLPPKPKPTPKPIEESYIVESEPIITYTPPPPPPKRIVRQRRVYTPTPQIGQPVSKSSNLGEQKRRFLKRVRATIYANKHYPIRAKRRRIEGRVHLVFDIDSNGEATNIRVRNGHKLLRRAVKASLKRSFPMDIPPTLRGKFPMRNISVNVDFRLE
jgi:protein TonB